MSRLAWGLWILLAVVNVYVIVKLQPEIQAASDRICVPLYSETGMECCQ